MAWNISFHLDDSHDGTYYGSAWFAVRVNGKIQRKWAHKFTILGEPLVVLTYDKHITHLDLRNALWNTYAPSNEDAFIRWSLFIRDTDDVCYTAKMHILLRWLRMKHNFSQPSIESIARYGWSTEDVVRVMPLPFSMLFDEWG